VPYYLPGTMDVGAPLTIEPGVTMLMTKSIWLSGGTLTAEGTAEKPILWTSAVEEPTPTDYWHCFRFNTGDEARFAFNDFEYAGKECNADPENGVIFFGVADDVFMSDLTFSNIVGPAINGGSCSDISASVSDWCAFDYSNVGGKIVCGLDDAEQCP
jgi:hypothetical protein